MNALQELMRRLAESGLSDPIDLALSHHDFVLLYSSLRNYNDYSVKTDPDEFWSFVIYGPCGAVNVTDRDQGPTL